MDINFVKAVKSLSLDNPDAKSLLEAIALQVNRTGYCNFAFVPDNGVSISSLCRMCDALEYLQKKGFISDPSHFVLEGSFCLNSDKLQLTGE